jgi:hypothetical protein
MADRPVSAIIVFGVINIVTDWFILLLPIPIVLGLRLDSRKKWSICSLFLIGFAVCVISIIRLFYAKQVETVDPSCTYLPSHTSQSKQPSKRPCNISYPLHSLLYITFLLVKIYLLS